MGAPATRFRGFRNGLPTYVPKWLSNRPGFQVGFKFLWSMAAVLDFFVEQAVEGVYAWYPGVGTPTALSFIGQSRGIQRGPTEASATYAQRLVAWRETWEGAGSSEILAEQIQACLGTSPTVRVVDRSGNWVTVAPDGTVTKTIAAWDWDSVSNPERAGWWSDLWIIVYPAPWPVTGSTLASLVGVWGNETPTQLGTGHAVPRPPVDAILALVEQWKGAHTWVEAIIWSYDPTLFVPGSPVSGDPDGTWGNASKVVAGVQVPARLNDGRARFWIPSGG